MSNPKIPSSIHLEKKILGTLLSDSKAYPEIKNYLNSLDFAKPEHQKLYSIIEDVYARDKVVDINILTDYLVSNSLMDSIGGEIYFIELQSELDRPDTLINMAKIIRNKLTRRKIQEIVVQLYKKLSEDLPETDAEIDKLITQVANINKISLSESFMPLVDSVKKTMLDLCSKTEAPLKTGFIGLDEIIGGFTKSNLIIIAARPGMGKTMLALNMSINMAKNKYKIAFLSLEMSDKEINFRCLATMASMSYREIVEFWVSSEQMERINGAVEVIKGMQFFLSDSIFNVKDLRRAVYNIKREANIDILFVDYLQLIGGDKHSENRNIEVSVITRELKILAKELDIAIVLLSQLNRGLESRVDKRPIASDLRDSGAIEQNADIVLFIYRDRVYNEEANPREAELIVNKNRNGWSNITIPLDFDGRTMTFRDKEKTYPHNFQERRENG